MKISPRPPFRAPVNVDRRLEKDCFLYFIESGEFVKVGLADNLAKRLVSLQLGNPHPMRIAHYRKVPKALSYQVERQVHALLADWSVGREWFRMSASEARQIAQPVINHASRVVRQWRTKGIPWEQPGEQGGEAYFAEVTNALEEKA